MKLIFCFSMKEVVEFQLKRKKIMIGIDFDHKKYQTWCQRVLFDKRSLMMVVVSLNVA